ncbi:uncharacterized protein LOC131239863 [Magnolia sinica]|uniref:uncharacterized protein LOC131239863 n=1 Tax=Magnolia sinica TaxID=86752 RepID=UPI00265942D0|nr:uncharacterized protein LOC131239863 [Magnolia sinica]
MLEARPFFRPPSKIHAPPRGESVAPKKKKQKASSKAKGKVDPYPVVLEVEGEGMEVETSSGAVGTVVPENIAPAEVQGASELPVEARASGRGEGRSEAREPLPDHGGDPHLGRPTYGRGGVRQLVRLSHGNDCCSCVDEPSWIRPMCIEGVRRVYSDA